MMFLDNLSCSILRICNENELSYESASERCNISARFLGDIVRRKSSPTVTTLEKICHGLGKTPSELLGGSAVEEELSYRRSMAVAVSVGCSYGEKLTEEPVCPRCGGKLEHEYQDYCACCGQRLEWSANTETAFSLC